MTPLNICLGSPKHTSFIDRLKTEHPMSLKVAYKIIEEKCHLSGTIHASMRSRKERAKAEIFEMTDNSEKKSNLKMEGEGSREGSRRFQDAQHEFAEKGDVEGKAKEAARALEGEEAAELEKARKASASGKVGD